MRVAVAVAVVGALAANTASAATITARTANISVPDGRHSFQIDSANRLVSRQPLVPRGMARSAVASPAASHFCTGHLH